MKDSYGIKKLYGGAGRGYEGGGRICPQKPSSFLLWTWATKLINFP